MRQVSDNRGAGSTAGRWRVAAAAVVAAALAFTVSGCGAGFRAPTREAVVYFKPDVTRAEQLRVHAACDDVPHTQVEPFPTSEKKVSTRMYPVRFRVDKADDAELQKLFDCLRADPSVDGVRVTGLDD